MEAKLVFEMSKCLKVKWAETDIMNFSYSASGLDKHLDGPRNVSTALERIADALEHKSAPDTPTEEA